MFALQINATILRLSNLFVIPKIIFPLSSTPTQLKTHFLQSLVVPMAKVSPHPSSLKFERVLEIRFRLATINFKDRFHWFVARIKCHERPLWRKYMMCLYLLDKGCLNCTWCLMRQTCWDWMDVRFDKGKYESGKNMCLSEIIFKSKKCLFKLPGFGFKIITAKKRLLNYYLNTYFIEILQIIIKAFENRFHEPI